MTFSRNKKEISRKVIHIVFHVVVGILAMEMNYELFQQILIGSGLIFVFLDLYRINQGGFLNDILRSILGEVVRPWEIKRFSASSFSLLSLMLVTILFQPEIFCLAALFLGLCDPAATITRLASSRLRLSRSKPLEGLIAFVLVALVVSYFFYTKYPDDSVNWLLVGIIGGLFGASAESLSIKKFDDNLTVPIASAVGIWLVILI